MLCRAFGRRFGAAVHVVAIVVAITASGACTSSPSSPSPQDLAGFAIAGDPAAVGGATWTYQATDAGVTYDLRGVLFKPEGAGPFPAVIISHGAGGSASQYSTTIARTIVQWGLVTIGTNYTHAGNAPLGAPGTANDLGASPPNLLRAAKLLDILRALGYVNMTKVAAHGHSMGGFATAYLVASRPSDFVVASHTASGIVPDGPDAAAPSESEVRTLVTPYQMHHGDRDNVVPLAYSQRLASALQQRGIPHELHIYPGADHDDVSRSAVVLDRVRAWYTQHGLFR